MSNYGHPIRFGMAIPVSAQEPQRAIDVAGLGEDLRYDLVLFDTGADPFSLATWAAARTDSIRIVPEIRPVGRVASVVARSMASLQLLSGGRAELMLCASDADLDVVEEAVGVIRALLDTTSAGRAVHDGAHHSLARAETGPALEHEIPIWIAGATAGIAELAGRLADGWLADLNGLHRSDLASLNETIDNAATSAGRDPREIQRAGIVDAESDAPSLISLAVDFGMSTFVARTVDEYLLESFIDVVAPAVGDGVAKELPPGALSARPIRRADVRARRRKGITYDRVPDDLVDTAVEPGDAAFATVRSTYMRGGNPGLVLQPGCVDEVVSALAFARDHRHLPLGIRAGGHGVSGRSTNDGGLAATGPLVTAADRTLPPREVPPHRAWLASVRTVWRPRPGVARAGDHRYLPCGGHLTRPLCSAAQRHHLESCQYRSLDHVARDRHGFRRQPVLARHQRPLASPAARARSMAFARSTSPSFDRTDET